MSNDNLENFLDDLLPETGDGSESARAEARRAVLTALAQIPGLHHWRISPPIWNSPRSWRCRSHREIGWRSGSDL